MRRPGDRDHGASTVEYAGLIVLAAVLLVGIVSTGLPARVGGSVGTAICRIFDGTNCGPRNGGQSDGSRPNGGGPAPTSSNPGGRQPYGRAPITLPNILSGAGSYLASTAAGVGDFFHNLGPNLVKGLRWIVGTPPPPRTGPQHGWPGFWHGFWHTLWDETLKPVPQELLGAGKELLDQATGVLNLGKQAWCASTTLCSAKDVKDARDTFTYIWDHPGDAAEEAGKAIIEPCKTAAEHGGYEQAGRCGASIITTIIGAKGLTKLGKLGKLARVGKLGGVGRIASDAERAAADAERAAKAGDLAGARKAAASARSKARAAARAAQKNGDSSGRARQAARAADRAERAANSARFQFSPNKWKYIFGKADRANQHNADRTAQNYAQMRKIGVYDNATGRRLVEQHLRDALKDDSNISRTFTNSHGRFQVRESLFKGPGGFLKLETTWQETPDGHLRFTTVIPRG